MDSSQENASSEKKGILEGLDRDELIRKCKGLLGIAQKAKKAKDELAIEVGALKEKLTECDTQKHADKECLKTMQMMVDSLTEQKLQAANKIADYEKSIKKINQELTTCNGKLSTLTELEIQIEAKDKQIQRLTDENEEQEMDLRKLDEKLAKVSELSQHQTQELLVLEQSIDKWKAMEAAYHKLQHDNKELQAKFEAVQNSLNNEARNSQNDDVVNALQMERDENRRLYDETKSQFDALNEELNNMKQGQGENDEKIDVLKEQLEYENKQLKKQCDEQKYKLNKYKAKICEFSSKLKEVKQSKKLLGETVFEYSKSVSKWHVQISHASKLLVKEANSLNETKDDLEKKLDGSEAKVKDLTNKINELELQLEDAIKNNDTSDVKEKYEMLLLEYKSLQKEIEEKNKEISNLTQEWEQVCSSLKDQNEKCGIEIEQLNQENQTKVEKISQLEKQVENSEAIARDFGKTIDELKLLNDDLLKNKEADDVSEKYNALQIEYESLQKIIDGKNSKIDNLTRGQEQISVLLKGESEKRDLEIERLSEQIQVKSQRITDLEKQIEDSEAGVKDLKNTINELDLRIEDVMKNNEINDVKVKYETLLEEYNTLETKHTEFTLLAQEWEKVSTSLKRECEKRGLEVEKLTLECQEKDEIISEFQKQVENSELVASDMKKTIQDLEQRLEELSSNNEMNDVTEKFDALMKEYETLKETVKERDAEISKFVQDQEQLRASTNDENEKLELKLEKLNEEIQLKSQEISQLATLAENTKIEAKEKYEALLAEHENLESKNSELINIIETNKTEIASLKEANEKLVSENDKMIEENRENAQKIADLLEREVTANEKNAELLAEMRELNDVFKTRGEVISNQTDEINQLKVKLDELSKQFALVEENLKEKSKQNEQLRNQFDSQSEILSTSTISRADEVSRMRDIEDSFEEKYNKLRGFALKLKKKIAEQQSLITKLESTASANTNAPSTPTPAPNSAQSQNLISLQKDNDRLLDQIDAMKSEQKQFKSEINQLNEKIQKTEEEARSLRILNEDIKATADTNLKIKSALDEQIKSGEKQIDSLKNENKNFTQQLKNAENEIIKIKDVVKQKESEITQKSEEVTKIKAEMNKLKASMKKNNVLNLEVEAYEKSLKEMSQKYDSTVKQLSEAKIEIDGHQITIKSLNTEIQTLNNQIELEKQNSNEYQQQSELQRIKLKENNSEITELKRIIDDHVKEANQIKIELANLKSQQSDNEVEKQRFISKIKSDNENNVTKILSLEEEVRDLRSKLSNCEQELANVQTDFTSYKIKAQAVLRQNQSKDSSSEQDLKEELAILNQTKEDLNVKLSHASEQQRRLEITIEELKGEKINLQDRCKKLLQLLDETRQQIETMQTENRKQTQEHHEALKTQRLQVDTLSTCFKNQIEEMEMKHAEEIAILKSRTIEARSVDANESSLSLAKGAQLTTEQRIELIMMERQDGEGSECTSSTNLRKTSATTRGKHEVIPLDELLNNTFDEETEPIEQHEKVVSKEKFEAQQSRLKHMSTLLSEAEMDVTRLTEMNTMLKEELRRQERSTEREKEMKNLEYMKNVIFKFLTINNADERAHLVPVINIILKLSPDESKTLQTVARGGDGGQSSWSNLLPMW